MNHAEITARVLEMMATHGTNWINPFARKGRTATPVNVASGKPYRGGNLFLLWWAGHGGATWGTYRQWEAVGAQVRKGEKATRISFWKPLTDPANPEKKGMVMKGYSVFNQDQVDGWAEADAPKTECAVDPIVAADAFVDQIGARIHHHEIGRAFYNLTADQITMPAPHLFQATPTSSATELYYSTLLHELTHWTGHGTRCDRPMNRDNYAQEELVAELGAAILCAELGISPEPRPDHAHYLNAWMERLSNDKRAFSAAATQASRAVEWLNACQVNHQQEAA